MSIISFKIQEVKKLVDELKAAQAYSVTTEDLFNPAMYPDGVPRDEHGRSKQEAGELFWPSSNRIDQSKVKPVLMLVGDHGLYLITNAKAEGSPASRGTVIYAAGCNPKLDDDFYENKCELFGDNDGSIRLPMEWADWAIQNKKRTFRVKITRDSISLVTK
ncbi:MULTISPECIES: DUF3085 domain-containing protein [Aeromonas]|uniref:DUF3085 domain-containing protein n=1 Tax=Aeromonas salmonicida TaxID=645 RepID=A0AAX1PCE1_AERSA|nr:MULTISPECIES: DUF3085 domain-containing protein [Aeromonas]MDU4190153.1 DUF3085 domain-containing protein [Aeromonas sp.]RAI97743.1 hypothetical protein DEU50_13515 [Aeromonas salmonicida]